MKTMIRLLLPLTLVLLTGCANHNASWDYNPDLSLSYLKTYRWLDNNEELHEDGYLSSSLTDERVHKAVNDILNAKGLNLLEGDQTIDVLVTYNIGVKKRLENRTGTTSVAYRHGFWGAGLSTDHYVDEFDEGILTLDFVDPETKKVLWRGTAKKRVRDYLTPEQRIAEINRAVIDILAGFPRPER